MPRASGHTRPLTAGGSPCLQLSFTQGSSLIEYQLGRILLSQISVLSFCFFSIFRFFHSWICFLLDFFVSSLL